MWVGDEHLQKFAKINLVNLVIWQLAKIYAKLKRRLSPRVCHLDLVKLKIRPTKITGSTTVASHPVAVPSCAARRWPSSTPAGHLLLPSGQHLLLPSGNHLLQRRLISFFTENRLDLLPPAGNHILYSTPLMRVTKRHDRFCFNASLDRFL